MTTKKTALVFAALFIASIAIYIGHKDAVATIKAIDTQSKKIRSSQVDYDHINDKSNELTDQINKAREQYNSQKSEVDKLQKQKSDLEKQKSDLESQMQTSAIYQLRLNVLRSTS